MAGSKSTIGPRGVLIDDARVFAAATRFSALEAAWAKVLSNAGAAGGDGMTVGHFLVNHHRRLARLGEALTTGDYRPGPIRRVDIPKQDGGVRTLAIPSVIDRVAQTAFNAALAPLIDAEFEDSSFAYRAGRSVDDALRMVRELRDGGRGFVVDADIEQFFDRVCHDRLMARLGETMTEGPTTELISLWLAAASATGRGLAQGSPLSPLLANLYLDRLDEAFQARGARIVRFADDFVILTESRAGAEAALNKVAALLAEERLELNRDKTRITSFDQGFRFLGALFVRSMTLAAAGKDDLDETERLLRRISQDDAEKAEDAAEKAEAEDLKRRHGLDPGQRVLYLVSADRRLGLRNQAFSVKAGSDGPDALRTWREVLAIPHQEVDRIEMGPQVQADFAALRHALASDTPIAFVNGHGETLGWLAPRFGPRPERHLAQAAVVLNAERRIALAKAFVDGRLRNQRALLRRLNREPKDPAVVKALADLNLAIRRVRKPMGLSELMGHEGHGAALFWPAFGRLLRHGFHFRKRRRRGTIDPVNILLNVTSSLLARDITVALERAGLHPGFGVLHGTEDGEDAAVYDLMEEFRAPLAESVVAQAINGRAVGLDDFTRRDDGGHRLKSTGYAKVLRVYERAAARPVRSRRDGRQRSWRGIMVDQALGLAADVEGRETYKPYLIDY